MFGTVPRIVHVLTIFSFVLIAQCEPQVKLVQVLFRHGERTPQAKELYPKDPYNVSAYQSLGLGQLTNEGKMREYDIGKMLRTRYQNLVGELYHPEDVYAFSTDVDRTKMSLQLVLAGLYPPSVTQLWNTDLPWSPIPTHYVPEDIDILMRPHLCPQYTDALGEVMKLPEIQKKINAHSELFKFLTVKTGVNITETFQVNDIHNLLTAQKSMNFTMPEWCTNEILEKMGDVVILDYDIQSYTMKLKRLYGGTLVRRIIENMNVDGDYKNPRKVYLYSAHDINVAAFLRAHGIEEAKLPLYGTAVMLEKLVDEKGNYFVKMVLWTGVTEKLINLRLPGCDDLCPLDTYLNLVHDVIPSDDEMNCHWKRLNLKDLANLFSERIG